MLTVTASLPAGRERTERPRTDTGPPPMGGSGHSLLWLLQVLSGALDELDYGLLIVDPSGRLVQANHMGRHHCTARDSLYHLQEQHLHTRDPLDEPVLQRALAQAAAGRRSLIKLGEAPQVETVAIVPLPAPPLSRTDGAILVVFGRHQVCEALSVEHFARVHNLTHAEGMVLTALCDGAEPGEIARRFGVAVSTVRTQIASVRQKTQAASIRELVRQVAMLPPIVSVLGHEAAH